MSRCCARHNEILAVVKANAYGHGASVVAKTLEGVVTLFGVANLHEALELRSAGVKAPILLLGACLPEEREETLRHGFQVTASSMEEAMAYDEIASRLGITAHVHCVLDTGMGRMGFTEALWTNEPPQYFMISRTSSGRACARTSPARMRTRPSPRRRWSGSMTRCRSVGMRASCRAGCICPTARACSAIHRRIFAISHGSAFALYGVSPLPDKQDQLLPALT